MKNHLLCCIATCALIILGCNVLFGQTKSEEPCERTVGLLVTQFSFGTPLHRLPRVELRQCGEGSETLQIVAWDAGGATPSLVIDTTDFTVVQCAARGNVFIIETTGGPRDRVYAIVFTRGKPQLKLMRVTRGTAKITVNEDNIELVISGIYAGDAPERSETHRFELK
jgi:hypothetical protein